MDSSISRRDFIKYAGGGVATLVIGSRLKWMLKSPLYASAAVQTIELEIGDAIKQMVTHNSINNATCYHWVYKSVNPDLPPECPGPNIFVTKGDTVNIAVTNRLDEPHSFFIPGFAPGDPVLVDSGPIAPGARWPATPGTFFSFTPTKPGAYLYFDNLNAPVNRVMGLHGALVVMPDPVADRPVGGHNLSPYGLQATPGVQKMFDDFGNSTHFPGLAWEQGDTNQSSFAPPFRTYVWLDHQAAPGLFQAVGSLPAGEIFDSQQFVNDFLRSAFDATNSANFRGAQYFTIDGQSGHFSHNNPKICPNLRVGEPCVIHILNAGLWTHSMHLHANHFYIASKNGVVQENPWWLDVFEVAPMDRIDYVIPYMRPPDVPNQRGVGVVDGRANGPDQPLTSLAANPGIPGTTAHRIWPATEELNMFIPPLGTVAGAIPIHVQLSPMCFPMHDHSEPSQTSQGGNYNLGLIAGMNFTGDRNINPAAVTTFPNPPPATEFPETTPGPHPAAPPM